MNKGWSGISSIGMMLWCVGCASMVTIEARGTLKNEATIPSRTTYAVLPTTEVEKDPAFPAYARLVARKMDERGYKESDAKTATLGVYLAYGVTESSAGPSVSAPPQPGSSGGMGPGGMGSTGMGSTGGGYGGGSGYGGAVVSQSSTPVTRFVSQLVLVVGDMAKSRSAGALVELWRGETLHTSSSNDFPVVAPLLIDANFRQFGETTPTAVRHAFTAEDLNKIKDRR